MKVFFAAAVMGWLFANNAFAFSSTQVGIHHLYESARALGMGDAFTAVADDYSAVMYNPAALARRDSGQVNMSVDAAVSSNFFKFKSDLTNAGNTQGTDTDKFNAYSDFLNKYTGQPVFMRAGLLEGFWVEPNWGLAIIPADATVTAEVINQGFPALDIKAYLDTTVAFGYGKDIKGWDIPGELSVGVTGKMVNRGFASKQVNSIDLVTDSNPVSTNDLVEGYTLDADVGMIYTPLLPSEGFFSHLRVAKPSFSIVVRNLADYGFTKSFHVINKNTTSTDTPEKLYRVIDLGSKFEFPTAWIFGGRATFDWRDIGHPDYTVRKALHAGAEFDWTVNNYWKGHYRAGINQGYYTAGISAELLIFNLDAVTYGEDIGTANNALEDRVYALKMSIDI